MTATMTRVTKGTYTLGKSYVGLLERYPLLPVRTEEDYDAANAVVGDLVGRDDLNADEGRYLDSLLTLVAAYENKVYDFDSRNVSPLVALKSLLASNSMTAADLGRLIGSAPNATMILKGQRKISVNIAKTLAKHFKVDSGLFI